MTSTISLNKINSVIKKNFRLNSASFIITNLLALMGTVLNCYITIGTKDKSIDISSSIYHATQEYSAFIAVILLALGTVQLFFLSIKMFREIYSRRASDFFYSMPVTRKEYYIGNILYGIISIASLTVVVIAATLIFARTPILFDTEHNVVEMGMFFETVFSCVVSLFFEFSGFILAAVLCGKIWQVVAVSVLTSSAFSALISGITVYMNSIYGFYSDGIQGVQSLSGILALFNGGNMVSDGIVTICYLAATIIVFIIGYFVFKNRKAEIAEQSLSGRIMPYAILSVICAGVYITFSTGGDKLYLDIIYGIVSCIIAAVIYCAVFYKKAFTKSAVISAAAVCVIMSAFIIGVDILPEKVGYTDYVPEADKVQSIRYESMSDNSKYVGDSVSTVIDDIFYFGIYDDENTVWNIESKEGIDGIIALHKKAVSDDVINKYNDVIYSEDDVYSNRISLWYSFKVTYTLNNGKTVTRCYAVDSKDILEEYGTIAQSDEVIDQCVPFTIDTDSILFARIEDMDTEVRYEEYDEEFNDYDEMSDDYGIYYSENSYFTLEDYTEFFELYRKDIKERDKSDLTSYDLGLYYFMSKNYAVNDYSISIYCISEDCPAEMAEKFRKMTPKQVEKYMYDNYNGFIQEEYISITSKSDKNIVSYLTDRGILK